MNISAELKIRLCKVIILTICWFSYSYVSAIWDGIADVEATFYFAGVILAYPLVVGIFLLADAIFVKMKISGYALWILEILTAFILIITQIYWALLALYVWRLFLL